MNSIYFKVLIYLISGILFFPSSLSSQEVIKYQKKLDSLDILVIGKLDSAKLHISNHYLLTKRKNGKIVDTLWKSDSGGFSNDYIKYFDIYLDSVYSSFLLSSQLGVELILSKKESKNSRYITYDDLFIPIQGKEKFVKRLYLSDKKTVKVEYLDTKVEIFEGDSTGITKYIEYKDGTKIKRMKIKIKDSERYFVE